MDVLVNVVGYVLANRVGELATIPATIDDAFGRELIAQGWRPYRRVLG